MNDSLTLPGSNSGKELIREVEGVRYERWPIKTHVVMPDDEISLVVDHYAKPHLKEGDVLFMSERVVAITQGRSYKIDDIEARPLAVKLSKYVHKTPAGIGLGSPWTMELAIREVGTFRILLAAAVAAVTKPLGIRGMFYRVAGREAAAIDGPCDYTLPPYNTCATLGPKDPNGVARTLAEQFGVEIVIIDANDLGVDVLGRSKNAPSAEVAAEIFKDNPLGQSSEQTPLCIVRRA
ncbi:MAG: coenzyme F420-0:L-glutamate ligase [Candidatus Doudnabacteria bacterium]|nr:coenzyme F420-0:L-glutamate ligase [Candidatus Doudnabacteria bacterium]